jgi:hypothetical protein
MLSTPHVSKGVKDGSNKLTFGPLHHWEIGEVQNRSGQSDKEMNITVTAEKPTPIILHLAVTLMAELTKIKLYVINISVVLYESVLKTEA